MGLGIIGNKPDREVTLFSLQKVEDILTKIMVISLKKNSKEEDIVAQLSHHRIIKKVLISNIITIVSWASQCREMRQTFKEMVIIQDTTSKASKEIKTVDQIVVIANKVISKTAEVIGKIANKITGKTTIVIDKILINIM
jgi:hypothetical protein